MKLKLLIGLFALIQVLLSCQDRIVSDVRVVLDMAGENEKELKKVLTYYQAPRDSLKLKAALFLIKGMRYKYSLEGSQLGKFNTVFSELEKLKAKKTLIKDANTGKFTAVDSIWNKVAKKEGYLYRTSLEVKPDLYFIKAAYLIENIEYAFKAWNFPWCSHLTFDEFCEYILPYRFMDESLISWRSIVSEKYNVLIDSIKSLKIKDPVKVCEIVNSKLSKGWRYSHTLAEYPVAITVDNLFKAKMGSCTHQTGFAIFVMRALGVPVVHEQVPHYGNRSLGHDFNAVLDKDKKFVNFEVGVKQMGEVVKTRFKWDFLIPKIYRKTYADIENSLAVLGEGEEIPPYFKIPNLIDVTEQYLSVSEVKIELTQPVPENSNFVYLCTFDNEKWKAVSWTKIEKKTATFKNMGQGFMYMPMYYKNGQFLPASHPLKIDITGKIISLVPSQKKELLLLKRKFKPRKWFRRLTIGGKFQASNKVNFEDAIDLYVINDTLDLVTQNIPIQKKKKYRYVRYLFPANSKGQIGEMSFFSGNNKIIGDIITAKSISNEKTVKNAFDGSVITFVETKEKDNGQWIGLDFGEKKNISKLSFCPRTDKNNVWKQLNYEFFYWRNGWNSLGVKKATSYELEYESPASNVLYLLKCLDEGKEERIFTYKNGKQIWW